MKYRDVFRVDLWMIILAMVLACVLIIFWFVILSFLQPADASGFSPTALLSAIPAPSATPTPSEGLMFTPTLTPGYVSPEGFSIGSFVQIIGTEGAGLRLRSAPGTNNAQIFLGMDAEVFKIKDGPRDSDGFSWWFLEAPYDENRSGWAASKYLQVIAPPP